MFAFVLKEVDENYKWDRSKPIVIRYVKTCSVRDYLKKVGLFDRENVKIPVTAVDFLEEADFADIERGKRVEKCRKK